MVERLDLTRPPPGREQKLEQSWRERTFSPVEGQYSPQREGGKGGKGGAGLADFCVRPGF
jgi:hypothetical protein